MGAKSTFPARGTRWSGKISHASHKALETLAKQPRPLSCHLLDELVTACPKSAFAPTPQMSARDLRPRIQVAKVSGSEPPAITSFLGELGQSW